ncbi:MAG: sensor histidine kinase [Muribaculaceae bacterium]|nr:sensor histidine kinase [Muribaculaceae bacterium]
MNNMTKINKRELIIHVLCWGIVLFFPLLFYHPNDTNQMAMTRFLRGMGGPVSCMVLFYVNYLWLIPKFYFREKKKEFYLINIIAIVLCMGLMVGWWQVVNNFLDEPVAEIGKRFGGRKPPRYPMFFYNFLSMVLVVGLSLAVSMTSRWQHIEDARKEAEQNRTKAELANLRNQLNPHFLLNTLNNIYALIAFDSDKAQTAVEELSRLLRHVLYDNQQQYVPLYKEVEFMHNYLELMKIRVTKGVTITTDINVEPDDSTPIAPLIFISLLENAFKHGISPSGSGSIDLQLSQNDGVVTCCITNTNYPKRDNDKSGSGIGLEQVSKRLELMYPDRYQWERGTRDNDSIYYSKITIDTHDKD